VELAPAVRVNAIAPGYVDTPLAAGALADEQTRRKIEARVPLTCGRCLEPYTVTVHPSVDARFVPAPATRGEERELGADDLETDVYQHGQLDLTALLETETNLALPMKPLCGEGCRGLCPVCGGNRNVTACACETHVPDPRWAALKGWAERTR